MEVPRHAHLQDAVGVVGVVAVDLEPVGAEIADVSTIAVGDHRLSVLIRGSRS